MKTILAAASLAALTLSASAFAQPISSRDGTMTRAIKEVTENAVQNPQAPGLPNAVVRLTINAAKHAEPRGPSANGADRVQGVDRIERVERVERPERPERIERIEIATRSEIARAQRPDRSQRPDRPQRNGRK
jgi:hypothetical protein